MLKTTVLSLALVLASVLVLPRSAALAQVSCNDREKITDWLGAKYQEAPVAAGINNKGALVEVFATKDGETWTILLTAPNGTSCIVETGEAWHSKAFKVTSADPQA